MTRARLAGVAAGAAAVLLAGACGTTDEAAGDGGANGTDAGAGPVTVTDTRGEEITLDAPAERVVALEWGEAEMLTTLGAMPVGVADAEGYGTWVTAEPLDDDVEDVGTRQEPSVDSVVALEPDLVVASGDRSPSLVEQLEEYVPVVVTTGSDASDNLGRMREDFTMLATAVGAEDEAEQVLADFDQALADAAEDIAAAEAEGAPFAMADGWEQGSSVAIRMFGDGSLMSEVATEVGLRNAWTGEGDEVWGLQSTDVEGLTNLSDQDELRFLYNASDGADVFGDSLSGNSVWESLPFVEQGRVHRLSDGIWTFGGPASCTQFAEELVSVFAGQDG